jgi:hypothetical protein
MDAEVIATVLTGAGVLLGVWRLLAHYEDRNDRAHAALTARVDRLYELLLERLPPARWTFTSRNGRRPDVRGAKCRPWMASRAASQR